MKDEVQLIETALLYTTKRALSYRTFPQACFATLFEWDTFFYRFKLISLQYTYIWY